VPIIDAHVHAFPERLALAVRERLNQRGQLQGSPLLAHVAEGVLSGGFDGAWILPYAHRAGVARSVNEWSAAEVTKFPWLVPGATFHPGDEDLPALCERALVSLGLRVVKLHCSVGQFSPGDARLAPLWEMAAALGVPVVVHAGQVSPGLTAAGELDELIPVLRRHRGLRLVLAHTGHPACEHALELMDDYPNLCGDLTPVWDQPVCLQGEDIVRRPGRFLFGSDAPNNPVPATNQLRRWAEMSLSDDVMGLLAGGTAARLLAPPGD
jgi:predicted TIM-barrel fold metal-dependent hydrolase